MQLYIFVMCDLATLDIHKMWHSKFIFPMQPHFQGWRDSLLWSGSDFVSVLCCVVLFIHITLQETFCHISFALQCFKDDVSCSANAKWVNLKKSCMYLFDKLYMHCWDTHVWNVFLHYTHTSPVLVVCLWSSMHVFTPINIISFVSPPPGMPVDVHSGAFRLWQIQNGSSFHGCIQNLYINNELQDFTKTQMKPGVVPGCEPCKKIYCVHGICQPDGAQGPVCHCQPGWSGPHCDQPASNPCQGSK